MNTCLNFVSSLERITLVRLATALWNTPEFRECVINMEVPVDAFDEYWLVTLYKVEKSVNQLPLPEILKIKLHKFIDPIGMKICSWRNYHDEYCKFDSIPLEFQWTSIGTIDRRVTAISLVEDESLDCFVRYRFACFYCLEDYIPDLWKQLNDYDEADLCAIEYQESFMVLYWSYKLCKEVLLVDALPVKNIVLPFSSNINTALFLCCLWYGNEISGKYFLQNISDEHRHQVLMEAVKYYFHPQSIVSRPVRWLPFPNLFYFILTCMNEEQRVEVFTKRCIKRIVNYLWVWPLEDFLPNIVEKLRMFCSRDDYIQLLQTPFSQDFHTYRECFESICQQIPTDDRSYVITTLLPDLVRNLKNFGFKIGLGILTTQEKEQFILSNGGKSVCRYLVCERKWDLLEYFLAECVTSANAVTIVRNECESNAKLYSYWDQRENVVLPQKIFSLLDNISSKVSGT